MSGVPRVTICHNPDCATSRNVLGLIRNTGEEAVLDILEAPQTGGFAKEDGEKVIGPHGNRSLRPAP